MANTLLANAGIPLVGATVCLGWFTIIPVSLMEAVIARVLLKWPMRFALRWVTIANLLTMLIGIPVTWFLAALATAVTTGGGGWGDGSIIGVLKSPAWLGPGYIGDLAWAAPLGLILLCVPFFLMSWWIEYVFLRAFAVKGLTADSKQCSLFSFVWKANLASYTFLVVLLICVMMWPWLSS